MKNNVEVLTEENFLLYAAANYHNNQCFNTNEFFDDLKRFKYLKRLFNKYHLSKKIKERLIINHLIVIYNVFGVQAGTRMLFLKLKGMYSYLKPFLIMMGTLPNEVTNIEGINIASDTILMDENIVEILRSI